MKYIELLFKEYGTQAVIDGLEAALLLASGWKRTSDVGLEKWRKRMPDGRFLEVPRKWAILWERRS